MREACPRFLIFFLICGLFLSCGGGGGGGSDLPPGRFHDTPSGLTLFLPDSINSHGLYLSDRIATDPEEIHQILCRWLDEQINRWIASHPERDPEELLNIARQHLFIGVDHWSFPCRSSDTGLCAGAFSPCTYKSAIYHKGSGPAFPTGNIPPHTIVYADELAEWAGNDIWRTGLWYWGEIPPGQIGFETVAHEFDHAIGIGD